MVTNKFGSLKSQKEKYQLWWKFLQVAKTHPSGEGGKREIRWEVYKNKGWGDVRKLTSFESWWKETGHLLQQPVSQVVTVLPAVIPERTIYIEVPLTRSPTRITKRVSHIIRGEWKRMYPGLSKKKDTGQTDQIRDELRVLASGTDFTPFTRIYKDHFKTLLLLYQLVFRNVYKGKEMMELVRQTDEVWKTGKKNGWTKELSDEYVVTGSTSAGKGTGTSMDRKLYRARAKLEDIVIAVCEGRFPS